MTVLSSRKKNMKEDRAVRLKRSKRFARRLSSVLALSQERPINPELSVIAHDAHQTTCMCKPLIISDPWFPNSANLSVQSSGAWRCNLSLRKSLLRLSPKPNPWAPRVNTADTLHTLAWRLQLCRSSVRLEFHARKCLARIPCKLLLDLLGCAALQSLLLSFRPELTCVSL